MKTYATRECAAHADVHYTIKNTNHVTTAVTARKHGGINNSRNTNNSEGVHTLNMGLFVPEKDRSSRWFSNQDYDCYGYWNNYSYLLYAYYYTAKTSKRSETLNTDSADSKADTEGNQF